MSRPVTVMVCFARSGGTLLNQILGSLPNTVVLSEVSPRGGGVGASGNDSPSTPAAQLAAWYGIRIQPGTFDEEIAQARIACEAAGRFLIIRDWTICSFFPTNRAGDDPPGRLVTLDAVQALGPTNVFAQVRNPVHVWQSRRREPVAEFLSLYVAYCRELRRRGIPIFRHEDLCREPAKQVRALCRTIGLTYAESWRDFASFASVNGDVQSAESRSRHFGPGAEIALPAHRGLDRRVQSFLLDSPDFREVCDICGYSPDDAVSGTAGSLSRLVTMGRKTVRALTGAG